VLAEHTHRVADRAPGQPAQAVFEFTGEPGAGANAHGATMAESGLQRILDRAGVSNRVP
jgi:hypothetical protein